MKAYPTLLQSRITLTLCTGWPQQPRGHLYPTQKLLGDPVCQNLEGNVTNCVENLELSPGKSQGRHKSKNAFTESKNMVVLEYSNYAAGIAKTQLNLEKGKFE